ncbi:MAG: AAA family ATPase [Calditrichaceae bacterium]
MAHINELEAIYLRDLIDQTRNTTRAKTTDKADHKDFGETITDFVQAVNESQKESAGVKTDNIEGRSRNLHQTMEKAEEAKLSFQLMLQKIDTNDLGKVRHSKDIQPCDIIAVTSGKGGVGKSMISANLAISLQHINKKVLLIDADIRLGNLDLILGTRSKYNITDVVSDSVDISEAIIKAPGNIDVLPVSSAFGELIKTEDYILKKLAQSFARFNHTYDIIVLDTGAGIAQTVISFLLGADKILVVVSTDPASIADAYTVIKVVKSMNPDIPIFLTVNMAASQEEGDTLYKKLNLMVHKFLNSKIIFGGSLLHDDLIAKSVKNQNPFVLSYPNAASTSAIKLLNRRILQASVTRRTGSLNIFERYITNKKIQLDCEL